MHAESVLFLQCPQPSVLIRIFIRTIRTRLHRFPPLSPVLTENNGKEQKETVHRTPFPYLLNRDKGEAKAKVMTTNVRGIDVKDQIFTRVSESAARTTESNTRWR